MSAAPAMPGSRSDGTVSPACRRTRRRRTTATISAAISSASTARLTAANSRPYGIPRGSDTEKPPVQHRARERDPVKKKVVRGQREGRQRYDEQRLLTD